MKRFSYRLEPLLKVKAHREKEKQRDLAEALQRVYAQKAQLGEIDTHREHTVAHQRQSMTGRLSLAELLVCSRYLTRLKKDAVAGQELLRGYERKADEKREKLVEATKEKKIYEKHKEKQQESYTKTIGNFEKKENDEIAGNCYRRKKAE
jgi:flagellar FliJ protein